MTTLEIVRSSRDKCAAWHLSHNGKTACGVNLDNVEYKSSEYPSSDLSCMRCRRILQHGGGRPAKCSGGCGATSVGWNSELGPVMTYECASCRERRQYGQCANVRLSIEAIAMLARHGAPSCVATATEQKLWEEITSKCFVILKDRNERR